MAAITQQTAMAVYGRRHGSFAGKGQTTTTVGGLTGITDVTGVIQVASWLLWILVGFYLFFDMGA